MLVGQGGHVYEWIEPWVNVPDEVSSEHGWAHAGLAINGSGELLTYSTSEPRVLVLDAGGTLLRSWGTSLLLGHGITYSEAGGVSSIWLADCAAKRDPGMSYDTQILGCGQVVRMDMSGAVIAALERPPLAVYDGARYSPTSIAVYERELGGDGSVWVADGYGQSYVHHYSEDGAYLGSINGEEGVTGRFNCPHGIWINYRPEGHELYIADRRNQRVQVYDVQGSYKRAFGSDFMVSPSAFALDGRGNIVVAELHGRLTVIDQSDSLVCYLGNNPDISSNADWPNSRDGQGKICKNQALRSGRFNSPHGMAVDADGNIYVTEWLVGGRTIKLVKQ